MHVLVEANDSRVRWWFCESCLCHSRFVNETEYKSKFRGRVHGICSMIDTSWFLQALTSSCVLQIIVISAAPAERHHPTRLSTTCLMVAVNLRNLRSRNTVQFLQCVLYNPPYYPDTSKFRFCKRNRSVVHARNLSQHLIHHQNYLAELLIINMLRGCYQLSVAFQRTSDSLGSQFVWMVKIRHYRRELVKHPASEITILTHICRLHASHHC